MLFIAKLPQRQFVQFFFHKSTNSCFGVFLTSRAVTDILYCHRVSHTVNTVNWMLFLVVKETFLTQNCVWPFQAGIYFYINCIGIQMFSFLRFLEIFECGICKSNKGCLGHLPLHSLSCLSKFHFREFRLYICPYNSWIDNVSTPDVYTPVRISVVQSSV